MNESPFTIEEMPITTGSSCSVVSFDDSDLKCSVDLSNRDTATDLDASLRFAAFAKDKLRYVPGLGWLYWDGKRWSLDRTGQVLELAKQCSRRWTKHCATLTGDMREKQIKGAIYAEQAPRIKAAIELAQSDPCFVLSVEQLDRDEWLLNVENGTLNLRTGELQSHNRDDLISKLAPVEFIANARHAMLDRFLGNLEARSPGMPSFLARCFGVCLTGDASPETLFLLQGDGGSGKTTLTEAVSSLLGDYAAKLPFESFCLNKHGRSPGAASPDLMRLRGARLAYASEGDQSAKLDSGTVKTITGGEPITARGLHADFITFPQTWKLWLVSNYDPRADSDDTGLWRRIMKLHFNEIPATERDPTVKEILTKDPAARSAVLAWTLAGCLDWQKLGRGRTGLAAPVDVESATADYRQKQDTLAEWWEDLISSEATLDQYGFTSNKDIRGHYDRWCDENGARPVQNKRFTAYLEGRGLKSKRTNSARGWDGISLD